MMTLGLTLMGLTYGPLGTHPPNYSHPRPLHRHLPGLQFRLILGALPTPTSRPASQNLWPPLGRLLPTPPSS